MKNLFFPARLARVNYFIRSVIANVGRFLLIDTANEEQLALNMILVILLTVYMVIGIYLPRIIDCGGKKWMLVFVFVPWVSAVYGLYLLFRPSEFTTIFGDSNEDNFEPNTEE